MRLTRQASFIFAVTVMMSGALMVQACSASGGSDDGFSSTDGATGDSSEGADGGSDSGTSDTGTTTDSGSEGGGACVVTPPSNICGIFPNCGCAGTTCDFQGDGGTACDPTAGTATGGQTCATSEDCVAGLTCLFGKCHAFCSAPGGVCTGVEYSLCHAHAGIADFNVCGIKCDLTNAASCGGGTSGCVATAAGGNDTTECEPVGATPVGGTCTTVLDCAPSLNCVNDGTLHCRKACGPTGAVSGCASGQCTALTPAITIDGVDYGYCP